MASDITLFRWRGGGRWRSRRESNRRFAFAARCDRNLAISRRANRSVVDSPDPVLTLLL